MKMKVVGSDCTNIIVSVRIIIIYYHYNIIVAVNRIIHMYVYYESLHHVCVTGLSFLSSV